MTKMRTLIKTFHLPRHMPDEARLKDVARELMFPYEQVVIESPRDAVHMKRAEVHRLSESERRPIGGGVLRITIHHSEDPGDLLDHLTQRLHLRARGKRRAIEEREVRDFLNDVAERPHTYTADVIHAQLNEWGPRVLPLLRTKAWDSDVLVQASDYMVRYLSRTHPECAIGEGHDVFLKDRAFPYGVKPMAENAAVGLNGWPMRGALPQIASVHLFTKVDLIAGWQKEEVVQRMGSDLLDGAIAMCCPTWPGSGYLGPRRDALVTSDAAPDDLPVMHIGTPLKLSTARSPARQDDMTMLARAANLVGNRDIALRARSAGKPQWWRLRGRLAAPRAQKEFIDNMLTTLRIQDGGLRIFTRNWWMRLRDTYVARMDFGHDATQGSHIYGVIAEADETEDLKGVKDYIAMHLKRFGARVDGPEDVAVCGGAGAGGLQLTPMIYHSRAANGILGSGAVMLPAFMPPVLKSR